jgi:hypothetical protein
MRCTFYVDGGVLEPWEEQGQPGPPPVGRILNRYGMAWKVTRINFTKWPGSPEREVSVWLSMAGETAGR